MMFRVQCSNEVDSIEALFTAVFAESETEAEGRRIGRLVRDLVGGTDVGDWFGFVGEEDGVVVASILLSRLTFATDVSVFLLAPVAVDSAHQGMGIGQRLIRHGLNAMKGKGVEFVITYGDPRFYSRVGFQPIKQEVIVPPFVLSQPEGWQGQSLQGGSVDALKGRCACVSAFDDPALW